MLNSVYVSLAIQLLRYCTVALNAVSKIRLMLWLRNVYQSLKRPYGGLHGNFLSREGSTFCANCPPRVGITSLIHFSTEFPILQRRQRSTRADQ